MLWMRDRAGTAVLDAFFTQPLQLDRLAEPLGGLGRLHVLVVEQVTPEGTADRDDVVGDVLDLHAQGLGQLPLEGGRNLGAAPALVLAVRER